MVFHVKVFKELIHPLKKEAEKEEKNGCVQFSSCVVVATFDGCVCQGGRPCSLMMAMPAHKPSPKDLYVCVLDLSGWMKCACGSDS